MSIFAKEKTKNCDLAVLFDDIIFEQQPHAVVLPQKACEVSDSFCFLQYSELFSF